MYEGARARARASLAAISAAGSWHFRARTAGAKMNLCSRARAKPSQTSLRLIYAVRLGARARALIGRVRACALGRALNPLLQ